MLFIQYASGEKMERFRLFLSIYYPGCISRIFMQRIVYNDKYRIQIRICKCDIQNRSDDLRDLLEISSQKFIVISFWLSNIKGIRMEQKDGGE